MHSPVGSGTLLRKNNWVKDLCSFSIIYFMGKQTLTISKAGDYALFSLCIFLKDYLLLKKTPKKQQKTPKSSGQIKIAICRTSLNAISCPGLHHFLLQLQILRCILIFSKPSQKLAAKSPGYFSFPLGFPFLRRCLRENQVRWTQLRETSLVQPN